MDNTLTLIAQYLFQHEHPDIAKQITDLPQFNDSHRLYLQIKHEITQTLDQTHRLDSISPDLIHQIVDKLVKISPELETSDLSEFTDKIKMTLVTFTFLEELFLKKNTNTAIAILRSLPENTDPSVRQNLSSLLLQNDVPNVFLNSIHWNKVKTVNESRIILVENLFRLLPPSNYLFPTGLESMIKDSLNYQQLSTPSFRPVSQNNISLNDSALLNDNIPTHLKHILSSHSDEVWFIKYSPDGKWLATGSRDTKIMIYDASNNYKLYCIFQLHTESVIYLAWNDSSTELLSVAFDQTLRIWSLEEQKCIKHFDNKEGRLSSSKFLPGYETNNRVLVASDDGKLFIIEITTEGYEVISTYNKYSEGAANPQIKDFTIQNNFIWAITLTSELLVFTIPDLKMIYKLQFPQTPTAITTVPKSFPGILSRIPTKDESSYVLVNTNPNTLILINTSGICTDANDTSKISSDKLPYIESFFYLPSMMSNRFVIRGCAGGNYNPLTEEGDTNIANAGIVISGGNGGKIWLWGHEGNVIGCIDSHEALVNCVTWRGDGYAINGNDGVEWASGSDDGKVCIWGIKN